MSHREQIAQVAHFWTKNERFAWKIDKPIPSPDGEGQTFGPVMGRAEPLDLSWGGLNLWPYHGEGRPFGPVMGRAEPLDWSWGGPNLCRHTDRTKAQLSCSSEKLYRTFSKALA